MSESGGTVFIVDDDGAMRKTLVRLLESVDQPAIAYSSSQEFLSDWDDNAEGVLLLDIRMPEIGGMALQARIEEMHSLLPIIFLTGYGNVSLAVRAMHHGAFDFFAKPFDSQALLDSIQRALAVGARLRQIGREKQQVLDCMKRLTNRERQILGMMVDGKSNKVMATELSLSQRTVEVHRASVMKKMKSDSVATLVRSVLVVDEWIPATMPTAINRAAANGTT